MIKNTKIILLLLIITASSMLVFSDYDLGVHLVNAQDCDALENDSDDKKKCEELAEKAEKYQEIIDLKQKQQQSLSNQISIMNTSIYRYEIEIELNKKKIESLNAEVSKKLLEIRDKEESILVQRKLLSDLLKVVYENRSRNMSNILFVRESLNPFLSQGDQITQTSSKINEIVDTLKSVKLKLENEKTELEDNRAEITKTRLDLEKKSNDIESVKSSKANLLSQTQGEEAKYQKLLEKVEEQKLELLSIDELYSGSGLSASDFPKPDEKYYASSSWFYFQQDSKWANTKIGNTSSLLKDYGCAIASVAMVFTKHGESITPKTLAKQPIFYLDLIAWPKSWKSLNVSSRGSHHGNFSWSVIDDEIDEGNPVIVYIGKSGGKGGHYVVIHSKDKKGKYVVHDPYFGPNLFLDTSRALVGGMGTKTATYMDQMIVYK